MIALPLILLICSAPQPSSFTQPATETEGRYKIVVAKTPSRTTDGGTSAFDEVFLLDTSSGSVWIYEPASHYDPIKYPSSIYLPPRFSPVVVDGLNWSLQKYIDQSGILKKDK